MTSMRTFWVVFAVMLLAMATGPAPALTGPAPAPHPGDAPIPPQPVVAIHVSELTDALETMPAVPPTPAGEGTSGFQWWYTSWHYFVMHTSLEEALRSDGTPFVTVTDADISAGALLNADGSPKYPIVFSLASEAVRTDEIAPLRAYVAAGGFLFVGSSAFTRNPDGTTRGDFALATEMGLHMAGSTLSNWYENASFNKLVDHRLVSHIPWGSLTWHMPLSAEEIPWGTTSGHSVHTNHYAWHVLASTASVVAEGGAGPMVATNAYGKGQFIYHGAMQPLLGVGGYDDGMYSYGIYRNAIEWAFAAANLPIVKLSPWPQPYDAAFVVRHDFENFAGSIAGIEASAQGEHDLGAKGDYYFCTGTLRVGSEDNQLSDSDKLLVIQSLRDAVSLYGATIGSHNGGLPNPVNPAMAPTSYDYWHWGPDEALDTTPPGYADGKAYALDSIGRSFQDIEGWLAGVDNGRAGCGALGNCPRLWVSPYFNSARERSLDIFRQLGVATAGEQKCGPFPHWTVSLDTPGMRYPHLSLPVSDWYVGSDIAQSMESHTSTSMHAAVDYYHSIGALINIYMHSGANGGLGQDYVAYNQSLPRTWAVNAIGVRDWWAKRSGVTVVPTYGTSGTTGVVGATVTGAVDPDTALEIVIPNWGTGAVSDVQVNLDGAPADPASWRTTAYGLKVRVGTTVGSVGVRYTPLETWRQTDWSGGPGQALWSDERKYDSGTGIDDTTAGQVRLGLAGGGGTPLFSDDFTRPPAPDPVPFTWTLPSQSVGNYAQFTTTGGTLNASTTTTQQYGFAYPPSASITDGSVESDIRFPAAAFGGGLMGRLNTSNGQRYGAWIYPDGSGGGSNVLKLIRFTGWTTWTGTPIQQVSLPSVGTGWHHMKMSFTGAAIRIYYDDMVTPAIDATDATLTAGATGIDFWTMVNTYGPVLNNFVVRDGSGTAVFSDDFGPDATDNLAPWVRQMGTWTAAGGVLQGSSGTSQYGYASYDAAWTDYSVEGRVQFPAGAFGGGLGGRVDTATGAHYGAWIYPDGSSGGSNVLKLIKYSNWTTWSQTPMQQVSLPSVGTGWHTLKLDFNGNVIGVSYDGNQVISVTDNGFDGRPSYASGGISADLWTSTTPWVMSVDDVVVRSPATYAASGTLVSSAFDGGAGVQWKTIAWDAAAGGTTALGVRTRTADRADALATAPWSSPYPASGAAVAGPGRRFLQYALDLSSTDPAATPAAYEVNVTYVPGIMLPASNLVYGGPTSADSQSDVTLSAVLTDDANAPIAGRTVSFTLDGLGSVTGTTDAAGQATALLHVALAPGAHTLDIAFAGDGAYAPISISQPFAVTTTWSAWIQDTQADFAANTPTDVDTDIVPGSVVLRSTLTGNGEEQGDFSVGGQPGWMYRRGLFLDNPNTSDLRPGHSVRVVLDTASLVGASKLRADGDDLRVVWDDGVTQQEIDRLALTPFDTAATEVWFRTLAAVPAGGRDVHYFIYYGNPAAPAPPADPRNVWALWDGFDGTAVDTTLWQPSGSVSLSDGQAHFGVGGNLFGRIAFTDARFETQVRLAIQNQPSSAWWGWEDTPSNAPNILVFEEDSTGLKGLLRLANGAFNWLDLPGAPARTDWQTYAILWHGGQTTLQVNGAALATRTIGVPTAPMFVNLNAPQVPMDVEYVRARLDAAIDPIVTLATPVLGHAGEGTMLSVVHDAGQPALWEYLVWDATTPAGTSVRLRVRTADNAADIGSSAWVDYATSGLLISNPGGRYIQYEAILDTTEPAVTPELQKVTIYSAASPCVGGAPCATGQPGVCAAGTIQCTGDVPTCVPNTPSSDEICDGLDNDCNGTVDDVPAATVAIANDLIGIPGQDIAVPVQVTDLTGRNVYAADLTVGFDASVLRAVSVAGGSLLAGSGCTLQTDLSITGRVVMALYCTQALSGAGSLAVVTFQVATPTYGATTTLTLPVATLNEGCPGVVPVAGRFTVRGPEICDGQDNDGNGLVDDGLGQTTCGLGICHHTIDNCVAGQVQTCDPMQGAQPETCDGLDDNCDGTVDNGGNALCDDANLCNGAETCGSAAGCQAGTPVVCVALDQCHDAGVCLPATGACTSPAKADGTACDDASVCTTVDVCLGGVCTGGTPLACDDGNVCTDDTCDAVSGCAHAPNTLTEPFSGTALSVDWGTMTWSAGGTATVSGGVLTVDGLAARTNAAFQPGRSLEFVATFAADAFQHVGFGGGGDTPPLMFNSPPWAMFSTGNAGTGLQTRTWDGGAFDDRPIDGSWLGSPHTFRIDWSASSVIFSIDGTVVATHIVALPGPMRVGVSDYTADGAVLVADTVTITPLCDDGNPDTVADVCGGGVCAGVDLCAGVTCTPLDQCHDAGVCDHATGLCSNPAKTDGAACNDGNACTLTDACRAGVCAGANPVVCAALDQCHDPGVCQPGTGLCTDPAKANGSACNDGDACTQTDTCQSGACVGGNPVICNDNNACTDDVCDTVTGACVSTPNDGNACTDGNDCTTDRCSAGQCVHTPSGACGATGSVYYYRNNLPGSGVEPTVKPVPDVGIDGNGDLAADATTTSTGGYALGNLAGNVSVTPLPKYGTPRAADHNGAITSLDASVIARGVVGLLTLTPAQQTIAGDVTGNGSLSALDASEVARFVTGLIDHFDVADANHSDWQFLRCDDYSDPMAPACGPPLYAFTPITQPQTGGNFYAVLYGDVTGNWQPAAGLDMSADLTATSPEEIQAMAADQALADRLRREGLDKSTRVVPSPLADLTIAGWSRPLRAGERRRLTIDLAHAEGILGLDLALKYDPARITVVDVSTTGIGAGFNVAHAESDGSCRIAAYGLLPLAGSGSILTVTVEGVKPSGARLPLTVTGLANEGAIPLRIEGRIQGGARGTNRAH